jgi:hypothetical protein
MNVYELARDQLIHFFLTELSEATPPDFVEKIAKGFLLRSHNPEWVDEFWENLGADFIADLTEEYNSRIENGFPVYFTFIDDLGTKVRGWSNPTVPYDTATFQRALLCLTDTEFERLSGRILSFAGCANAWVTPKSHDQGLDAFGYHHLFDLPKISSLSNIFQSWIIIQAKHYNKEMVCTADVREFVGSVQLAKYRKFAVKGVKYPQLDLRPCTPIAYVLVTSGEVKRTTHLLAERAGVLLISASDLCAIFLTEWGSDQPTSFNELVDRLRTEAKQVSICQ